MVEEFRHRYPNVRVRVIGQNSAEVADAIRDGELEAGLVALPIDDRGLDVRLAFREENHYVSADPARVRKPMTIADIAAAPLILYDARWGAVDPLRRQLAERAQEAGVRLEPQIEVEYMTAALELTARGLGDTIAEPTVIVTRGYSQLLHSVSLDPPLFDTFAFVMRRNARLSPATRALMDVLERRIVARGGLD
jgi:DNA-binding transcriptional LysR family regulator